MYKLLSYVGEVPRAVRKYTSDDKTAWLDIPFSPDNTDYQEYLKWLSEGNEPIPADEGTA